MPDFPISNSDYAIFIDPALGEAQGGFQLAQRIDGAWKVIAQCNSFDELNHKLAEHRKGA